MQSTIGMVERNAALKFVKIATKSNTFSRDESFWRHCSGSAPNLHEQDRVCSFGTQQHRTS
ncbi:uncharacterized protein PHALS_15459 [Plasmopara halstedii]|uniref:Uncharacterized protein n=1 Tax=Plasmopara halstedii TaxID=4781 RepID=A0A0P1AJ44_PLAHL|nr:uncharacterized protein PHALS_15459 [Plasmopara halstedii]CEG40543.1 hypothetical protein PHALS_15459 [Plasmopara halstedii]|eukprot:XP_024576912.1 hypothetical protein PHALS_15459 [Plasmopara halstedii]